MLKDFYDQHKNFSHRTSTEYLISPGIRCKFDLIRENLDTDKIFNYAIDLGSSGNSVTGRLPCRNSNCEVGAPFA